ncbi:MAG: hypothetical protein ACTHKN_07430 [Achromobacter mucicolens]
MLGVVRGTLPRTGIADQRAQRAKRLSEFAAAGQHGRAQAADLGAIGAQGDVRAHLRRILSQTRGRALIARYRAFIAGLHTLFEVWVSHCISL